MGKVAQNAPLRRSGRESVIDVVPAEGRERTFVQVDLVLYRFFFWETVYRSTCSFTGQRSVLAQVCTECGKQVFSSRVVGQFVES